MKMIKGRHIRHDWQTFVDWDQKSVRTVCGMTSKRHLSGIPGFTEQDERVKSNGREYWGWCTRCVTSVVRAMRGFEHLPAGTFVPEVVALYARVSETLLDQYETMRVRALADEKQRHLNTPRHQSGACLTDGRGCQAEKGPDEEPHGFW
jgi:hypothetical protein